MTIFTTPPPAAPSTAMVLPAMAAPASCSRAASSERSSLDSIPSHVPTAARGTVERRPDPAGSLPGGARRQSLVRRRAIPAETVVTSSASGTRNAISTRSVDSSAASPGLVTRL